MADDTHDDTANQDADDENGDEGEEWTPEVAELRDVEDKDELDAHARRNLEQLRMADELAGDENDDEDGEARCDGGRETDDVPVFAVRRNPRGGTLDVAARGYGFPSNDPVSEDAHETFVDALGNIRDAVDFDAVDTDDRVGTLTVDENTREVLEFELVDGKARMDGGAA